MIRRFTIASIVVLALLIVLARAIGSTNKPPALAMLDPGDCPQPCWHGIRPGVTTVEEANSILSTDSMFLPLPVGNELYISCWDTKSNILGCIKVDITGSHHVPTERILSVDLWFPQSAIRLGDVVSLLGDPSTVQSCRYIRRLQAPISEVPWAIFLQFKGNILVTAYKIYDPLDDPENPRLDPSMFVYSLSYYPVFNRYERLKLWPGFVRLANEGALCYADPHP